MHIYEKDGKRYYSVTTILSVLGSKELMKWANSMGFKHIDSEKYTEDKAEFGTLVHAGLQKIIDPDAEVEMIQPKNAIHAYEANKCYDSFERLMKNYKFETICTEKTLVSHELRYAGTMDWVAKLDDKLTLIDFKTSKIVTFKYLLQLAGYMKLLELEEGITIERAAICIVREDKASFTFFETALLEEAYSVFQLLTDFYLKKMDLSLSISKMVSENRLPSSVLN